MSKSKLIQKIVCANLAAIFIATSTTYGIPVEMQKELREALAPQSSFAHDKLNNGTNQDRRDIEMSLHIQKMANLWRESKGSPREMLLYIQKLKAAYFNAGVEFGDVDVYDARNIVAIFPVSVRQADESISRTWLVFNRGDLSEGLKGVGRENLSDLKEKGYCVLTEGEYAELNLPRLYALLVRYPKDILSAVARRLPDEARKISIELSAGDATALALGKGVRLSAGHDQTRLYKLVFDVFSEELAADKKINKADVEALVTCVDSVRRAVGKDPGLVARFVSDLKSQLGAAGYKKLRKTFEESRGTFAADSEYAEELIVSFCVEKMIFNRMHLPRSMWPRSDGEAMERYSLIDATALQQLGVAAETNLADIMSRNAAQVVDDRDVARTFLQSPFARNYIFGAGVAEIRIILTDDPIESAVRSGLIAALDRIGEAAYDCVSGIAWEMRGLSWRKAIFCLERSRSDVSRVHLRSLLNHPDAEVVMRTLTALGEKGDEEVIKTFLRDNDAGVKKTAERALAQATIIQKLRALGARLVSKDESSAEDSLRELHRWYRSENTRQVVRDMFIDSALHSPHDSIRLRCLSIFRGDETEVFDDVMKLWDDKNSKIREKARMLAFDMCVFGVWIPSMNVILKKGLESDDARWISRALSLCRMRGTSAALAVIENLVSSNNKRIHLLALVCIRHICKKEWGSLHTQEFVRSVFRTGNSDAVVPLIRLCVEMADQAMIGDLEQLTIHLSPDVRNAAIEAIAAINSRLIKDSINAVDVRKLGQDLDGQVRTDEDAGHCL